MAKALADLGALIRELPSAGAGQPPAATKAKAAPAAAAAPKGASAKAAPMLSDLPTDLHLLILEHDEEKKRLKEENELLKTKYELVKSILDKGARRRLRIYIRYLDSHCDRAEVRRLLINAGLDFEDDAEKFDLLTILAKYRLRD